jgi:6-phosphofructokinase
MGNGLRGNLVVAQSGGPTAVINASLAGVIEEALASDAITGVFGALHGIKGLLNEELIDLGREMKSVVGLLRCTPSSALGSCRHKMTEADEARIMGVFQSHDVRYFVYVGGNDSMDTAQRLVGSASDLGYELRIMGVPKTVDNDLEQTDHCPGYGSVARWMALSTRDAGLDTEAMGIVDNVKIIECMGRNAGWITAASALGRDHPDAAPHLIYVPEKPITIDRFLGDVQTVYDRLGYCVVAVGEGAKGENGRALVESRRAIDLDSFGHAQQGGVAAYLCQLVADQLGLKARYDKPGTVQRVSAALASSVDTEEAYRVGRDAVRAAVEGVSGKMVTLVRQSNSPYACTTGLADLAQVAATEKPLPGHFLSQAGNDVTEDFIVYAEPLIGGSLPPYAYLAKHRLPKRSQ